MKNKVLCKHLHNNEFHDYLADTADLVFRPAVYAVIVADNKVLLVKQWDGYNFPGGGVNLGEQLTDALRREVWEETGLTVEPGELLACDSSFFTLDPARKVYHSILIHYAATISSGELTTANLEDCERAFTGLAEWIPLSDLQGIKFFSSVDCRVIIDKALSVTQRSWQRSR